MLLTNLLNTITAIFQSPKNQNHKLVYSIEEVSKITGLPTEKLYELIRNENIQVLQFEEDGHYRIPYQELQRLLKNKFLS